MEDGHRALISLENVDVDIGGSPVLREITWHLAPGEHWGIVGENGSGKSTFLALVAGTRWPKPGRGRRTYDFGQGPERDAIEARRRITLVGHELQDLYTRRGWNFAALDVVLSGRLHTDVPRLAVSTRDHAVAESLLAEMDAAHLAARPFLELSRGEQRRVLIARALAFEPQVLLLDEPLSGLDAAARASFNKALERAAAKAQLIVTAHAADDLPQVITHIAYIEQGRIAAMGEAGGQSAHRGFATPRAERRFAETALPTDAAANNRRRPPAGTTPLEPLKASYSKPAAARPLRAVPSATPLIEVRDADVWLGDRPVLRGIDWRLLEGEHWLVHGANGAGKSTFLRLLHGQLRPARGGMIAWPGLGSPRGIRALRRQVAWVSPELQADYRYRATVRECVASGFDSSLGLVRALNREERMRVDELLERFDLTHLAGRLQTELSYGQFRRALLARALVHRPRVLLLDEPWEGLDGPNAARLAARLDDCAAEGTHIVTASHLAIDEDRYTHRLVLDGGAIESAGPVLRPRGDVSAGLRGS